MKKLLLSLALFAAVQLNAQILNNDFENWAIDTIFFPGINTVPPDTFTANNPADWTSSNSISGADSLGGVFFVTQSNDSYSGSSSIRMVTDTIKLPTIPNFPALTLTIPGFALNGKFPISPNTLLTSGNTISPVSIKGAGQPFTQKLYKIKGYRKYTPVFNTNTNANDTCLVWATLRKGTTVVADAIYKSTTATNGYEYFEAEFKYVSCETPDTLVILLASSVPNVAAILGGNSGLKPGSELLIDSLFYETLPGGFNFPPIAVNDADTTLKNTAKDIQVKTNDDDCDNPVSGLTVSVSQNPANGTAVVGSGNTFITYTPAANFVGADSFIYTLNDGSATSAPAKVRIVVLQSSGINEFSAVPVSVYPVPAANELFINLQYNGNATAAIFDLTGKLVSNASLNNNINIVNITDLINGMYQVQIYNERNEVIARTRFSVAK